MGLFSRHANVHWQLAEAVVMDLANAIQKIEPKEFVSNADRLVPMKCKMFGISEELSNEQYKQIAQAAVIWAYEGRQAYENQRRDLLRSFKGHS